MSDLYVVIQTDFRLHQNKIALSGEAELLYRRILEVGAEVRSYCTDGWMDERTLQHICHHDSLDRVQELLDELVKAELVEVLSNVRMFRATHWEAYEAVAYNEVGDLYQVKTQKATG